MFEEPLKHIFKKMPFTGTKFVADTGTIDYWQYEYVSNWMSYNNLKD